MLGSPRRLATCCNTACGRPFRHHRRPVTDDPPSLRPAVAAVPGGGAPRSPRAAGTTSGGGGGKEASADTDVNTLLEQTFTGSKEVKSGNLELALKIEAQGGEPSELQGPVTLSLKGPFQSQGKGELPKFKLDASFEGAGQSITRGRHLDRREGLRLLPGHRLRARGPDLRPVQGRLRGGPEAGRRRRRTAELRLARHGPAQVAHGRQERGRRQGRRRPTRSRSPAASTWASCSTTSTTRWARRPRWASAPRAARCPRSSPTQQRQQVLDAVKDPKVEIYTGKDDSILRRLVVDLGIAGHRRAARAARSRFDISITDLNEDQDIAEPSDAKPFNELLGQLGGLGALGGARRQRQQRERLLRRRRRGRRRLRRGPRDVLEVPHGCGQRRRRGAQVRRPPDRHERQLVVDRTRRSGARTAKVPRL